MRSSFMRSIAGSLAARSIMASQIAFASVVDGVTAVWVAGPMALAFMVVPLQRALDHRERVRHAAVIAGRVRQKEAAHRGTAPDFNRAMLPPAREEAILRAAR